MRELQKLTLVLFMLLAVACSDSKFAGTGDVGETPKSDPSSTDATIEPGAVAGNGTVLPNCSTSAVGITQVKLLSNGISTQLGTQTLRYELSVLSCKDGSIQSLKDQPILFDLDASLASGFQPVPYAVLDSTGASISNAALQVVTGSDLFGNTGNFAHWTTQSFSYSSKLEKLILEIKLENLQVQPRIASDSSIKSYLRIGKAEPVTQALPILK